MRVRVIVYQRECGLKKDFDVIANPKFCSGKQFAVGLWKGRLQYKIYKQISAVICHSKIKY